MSKYSERVQLGLCVACGKPSNGYSKCEECRIKERARNKKRYEKRKSSGLCVTCGKPADNGCRCKECSKKASDYVTDVHNMRKENGLCICCGEPVDRNSKQFCTYHKMEKRAQSQSEYERIKASDSYSTYRADQTEYQRQRKIDRIENGLCIYCGKRKVYSERSTRMCLYCLYKTNKKQREYRYEHTEFHRSDAIEGVHCKTCLKPVENKGTKQCNRCREVSLMNLLKTRENHPWKNIYYGHGEPFQKREEYSDDKK